jgi:twitching motility protein PilT
MRVIPFTVPTLEELSLPPVTARLAELDQGLVLVTGISGSGKSSTVAGMINHINQNLHRHIVTIENPIEFLHRDVKCSVTQREVGVDTETFAVGLRAALRQDPDVIVIGEISDSDTLDTAIKAAERGHLVLSTLPTPDVINTVSRLHSMFPGAEREIGGIRLSEMLRGIIAQRLIPRRDEGGRVAAVEVLVVTPAARSILRDTERLAALRVVMTEGTEAGMQTFEQDLDRLKEEGEITDEAAAALGA